MSRRSGLSRAERNNRGIRRINGRQIRPDLLPRFVAAPPAAPEMPATPEVPAVEEPAPQFFRGVVIHFDKKTVGGRYVLLQATTGEVIHCPDALLGSWPLIFMLGVAVECEAVPKKGSRTYRAIKVNPLFEERELVAEIVWVHPDMNHAFARMPSGEQIHLNRDLLREYPALKWVGARVNCIALVTNQRSAKFSAIRIISITPPA